LAAKEGIDVEQPLINEGEKNNDRELIEDFLVKVKEAQKAIINMEKNNDNMKDITDKQASDNKAANQQSNHSHTHLCSAHRADQ
jgi:hypothetical protein